MLEKLKYTNVPTNISSSKDEDFFSSTENYKTAQNKINSKFSLFNSKLQTLINKSHNISQAQEYKKQRLREIHKDKQEFPVLINEINNLAIEEKEKEKLIFQINLFVIMHNFFMRESEELGDFMKNNKTNIQNIASAEAQQYIALAILLKPKLTTENFESYSGIASKVYKSYEKGDDYPKTYFNKDLFTKIKKGVYGLVGVYHYLNEKGYKVIFPDPILDANSQIDLLAINYNNADEETKNELLELKIDNIKQLNSLPIHLKKYITKIQVKCTKPYDKILEDNYDPSTKTELPSQGEKNSFFLAQGKAASFQCKFIEIPINISQEYINKSK